MIDFMKQYFSVVLDSGKLKFRDIDAYYVYGKYNDKFSNVSEKQYGFSFYTIINNKPYGQLRPTFKNVYKTNNYNEFFKYASGLFFESYKNSLMHLKE